MPGLLLVGTNTKQLGFGAKRLNTSLLQAPPRAEGVSWPIGVRTRLPLPVEVFQIEVKTQTKRGR